MNTTYWKNEVLSSVYLTGGRQFYIGLSSTAPNADGTGVSEPTGGSYARVLVDCFSEPVDGVMINSDTIAFPMSTAGWFTGTDKLMYYVIFDGAGSNANVLSYEEIFPQRTIEGDVIIKLPADTIRIELLDG